MSYQLPHNRVPIRKEKLINRPPSFTLETTLRLDMDLAVLLGQFILDRKRIGDNPAIVALGHRLVGEEL